LNSTIISAGIKRVVIPLLSNHLAKKYDPKDKISSINERIKRLEKFNDSNKGSMAEDSQDTLNTHSPPVLPSENDVSVSCIACARAHFATVSASLKEAVRFSRENDISYTEIQTRISTAEEEIVALERYDWSPEKILNSPPQEQEIINNFLPKVRELRQQITVIVTTTDLVKCAATAGNLHNEYRLAVLGLNNS